MAREPRLVAWLVTLFVLVAPIALWVYATGNPAYYIVHPSPPGQIPYVLSKLVALIALGLFWFQGMTALCRGNPFLVGFFRLPVRTHRMLGLALFALVCLHAGLFVGAVSMRSGHLAYGVLIPDFSAGFYTFYVSLGVVALALFPLGVAAGVLRRRARFWQWLHRIWLVVFGLVFLHGVSIGTETRLGLMLYVYYFIAVSLAAAAIMRAAVPVRKTVGMAKRNVPQGSSSQTTGDA